MDSGHLCRICLSKDDVTTIIKKENEALSRKLRLVGGFSIVEDDHLPQCICRACIHELQFAYDLISQYEATYKKRRRVSLHHKKETLTTVSCENKKKAMAEMVLSAKTGDTLVAEIVVKEEMFSDGEGQVERLESKIVSGYSKDISKYKIEVMDDSDEKNGEKVFGLNSKDSNVNENCSVRLYERKTNGGNCDVQDVDQRSLIEFSDAGLLMESENINVVVKEEAKWADEVTDEVEKSEHNKKFRAEEPKCKEEFCKAATLEDGKCNEKGYKANEYNISNKRFLADLQAQKKLLREQRMGFMTRDSSKCEEYTKKEHQTTPTNLGKSKLKECPESFVRLNGLNMKKEIQENVLQTNAFGPHENDIVFKYEKRDPKLICKSLLEQQDPLHFNSELQICDTQSEVVANDRMLEKHSSSDALKCKSSDKKKHLREHQTTHSNRELRTCEKCGKTFASEQSMNEHRILHLNPDAFKCTQCDKRFLSKSSLMQHTIIHSNPGLLTCEQCGKLFLYVVTLREHQILHSNPDAFTCKQCNKRFSCSSTLRKHAIIHSNPELLTCAKCGKTFACVRLMNEHKMLHLNPDAFKCDQCGKRCLSKSGLRKHKIIHSNPELLKCKQCGKTFLYVFRLKEHQQFHLNPDVFKCEQCGKRCSTKLDLKRHKIKHSNPESLTCEQCGKTFPYVHRLRHHKEWHLNPDAFKCKQCDKRFSSKHSLWQHAIIHSNPEVLSCKYCEKTFIDVYRLRKHQNWHLNPDAFKCKQCGRTFSSKSAIKRHKITHSTSELDNVENSDS